MYGVLAAALKTPNDVSVDSIDNTRIIDVNKRNVTEVCKKKDFLLCRSLPGSEPSRQQYYDLLSAVCLSDMQSSVKDPNSAFRRNLADYTLVIFVVGPWEVAGRVECGNGQLGRKKQTEDVFHALFDLNTTTTEFVWRTWGSAGTAKSVLGRGPKMWNRASAHNAYVKKLVDTNNAARRKRSGLPTGARVSYIDWGQAMHPRLYPQQIRIAGDINEHYGLEARLAFLQMLVNHMVEQDRQKELGVTWIDNRTGNAKIEDVEKFMTTSAPGEVLTAEENTAFETALSVFCGDCVATPGISCAQRKDYFQFMHKMPPSHALYAVMERAPACNKSAA
jgi:hypothetical protein